MGASQFLKAGARIVKSFSILTHTALLTAQRLVKTSCFYEHNGGNITVRIQNFILLKSSTCHV